MANPLVLGHSGWTQDGEALSAEIGADRLSYQAVLQGAQQPALDDWAYRFGEAVHHLRRR
jgi:hypothetical protein